MQPPTADDFRNIESVGVIIFEKNDPHAQIPAPAPRSERIDAAIPLSIVKRTESRVEDKAHFANEFSVGMTLHNIRVPFYLYITGTAELVQRGYYLLNSPVIVNPGEEIKIFLFKFDEAAPDIELPFADGLLLVCQRKLICDFSFPSSIRQEQVKKQTRRGGRRLEPDEEHLW